MGLLKLKKQDKPKSKPKFLTGLKVVDTKGKTLDVTTLWSKQTVVLKVLRRLGCPLCRYESRLLSELKPQFDDLNVTLAAITFEDCGLDDFLSGGFWSWGLYVDSEKTIHKALGLGKLSPGVGIADVFSKAGRAAIKAANQKNISGNFKGDGFQLGGTFVVSPDYGCIYEYKQKSAGLYPSIKEIFKAVGGDEDEVEEQAPPECIAYMGEIGVKIK